MTDSRGVPETAATGALWSEAADAFARWRDGEGSAIDELVRLLSPVLWQVARSTGLDREQAEDVVQQGWLALVDHAHTIDRPGAVGSWLCTTTRRAAWKTRGAAGRQVLAGDDAVAERLPRQPGPEAQVEADDEAAGVWRALQRLDGRCQLLLRMLSTADRPDYADVAATLDMPIGSIGPTRGRCLDKLRRELDTIGGSR